MTDDNETISNYQVNREVRRQELISASKSLSSLSKTLGAIFTVIGVLAVIGGLLIAFVEFADEPGGEKQQHVVAGLVIAGAALIQVGLVLIIIKTAGVIAGYIRHQVGRVS
jgi:hypothetical protein